MLQGTIDPRPHPVLRRLSMREEIEACQRLRHEVWLSEGVELLHPEAQSISDGHDNHGMHWGVFDDAHLVGAARLCLHDAVEDAPDGELFQGVAIVTPLASMNRLVVLKTYRGMGIGKRLDQVRIEQAGVSGAKTIIGAPVNYERRKSALRLLGFEIVSEKVGKALWSTNVAICPCYMKLGHDLPVSRSHAR
jgi:GNAT superfamily N-acetyltransferase